MRNERGIISPLHTLLIIGAVMLLFGGYSAWSFANTKYVDPTKQKKEEPKVEEKKVETVNETVPAENIKPASAPIEQKSDLEQLIDMDQNTLGMELLFESIENLQKLKFYSITTNNSYTLVDDPTENLIYNIPQKKTGLDLINNTTKSYRSKVEKTSYKTPKNESYNGSNEILYLASTNKIYLQQEPKGAWAEGDVKKDSIISNAIQSNYNLLEKLINDSVFIYRHRYISQPKETFDQALNKQVRIVEAKINIPKYTAVLGEDLCPQGCYIDLTQGNQKVFYYFEKDSPRILAIGIFLDQVKYKYEPKDPYGTINATLFKQFKYDQNPADYEWTKPSPIQEPLQFYPID